MPAPQLPAFDPHDVPESNATSYPEPHRAANLHRYNRSHRYAHSRQDSSSVLEGEVTLETNSGQQILSAGMCAGFPNKWRIAASRCLTLNASSRVLASIQVATCTGWTAAIEDTPAPATPG